MNELARAFVPEDAMDVVSERVGRIVRRAQKKGFPQPSFRLTGETQERPVLDELGEPVPGQFVKWVEVVIEGEPIKFTGWELVGVVSFVLDSDGRTIPVIDRVPGTTLNVRDGETLVEEYNYCDYCKTSRFRNETFLVVNEQGLVRQVGRNCLRDFLGHSPEAMLAMYDAYQSLRLDDEEIGGWGQSATVFYPPIFILDIASRIVAKEGYYVSKARAEEDDRVSTGELVRSFMSARGIWREEYEKKYPESDDSLQILNDSVIAIQKLDPDNEYEGKLMTLLDTKGVQWRHIGTLASGVIQGLRMRDRRATNQARGESHFIGNVGERVTLPVKVVGKWERASDYGPGISYIIRMLANESDDLIWWASYSPTTKDIVESEEFVITATIKDHEFDKRTERPTTVVTRAKVVRA